MKSVLSGIIEPRQSLEASRQKFTNRDLYHLILPIIVEQMLTMLVGICDTMMVSYAGEAAVSGVSLVNQVNNIFIFIFVSWPACGRRYPVYDVCGYLC